jgi:hypothetical protein
MCARRRCRVALQFVNWTAMEVVLLERYTEEQVAWSAAK